MPASCQVAARPLSWRLKRPNGAVCKRDFYSGAWVRLGPRNDLSSSGTCEAGKYSRNLSSDVQSVKNSCVWNLSERLSAPILPGRVGSGGVKNDLARMRLIRWVKRNLCPRHVPPATNGRTNRFALRLWLVLLVWQCAAAALACGRSERTAGDAGAGGTPSLIAGREAERDSAVESGGTMERQRPESDSDSDSSTERRPDEMRVEVKSGIAGRVTVGPACPVVEESKPCPDRPYQAELTIRRADSGDIVASVVSDVEGLFRVELPPGSYVVDPGVPRLVTDPRAEPVTVEVAADRFAQVIVRFDSGVR